MYCPKCNYEETKVVDSRSSEDGTSIRRRRECLNCGHRFTTYEREELGPVMIMKKDGTIEPFDHQKLLRSLLTACAKRGISLEALEEVVYTIEDELAEQFQREIPSSALGDIVLQHLKDLDKVAYIRFASVYKDFQDLSEFNAELSKVAEKGSDAES
ncbi:MAG: transcriptional regulator NrdR [Coriobacteriaceae bacterium]|nr:transcriptional regulator NrdR [Coriobacteriaceae bacterium]